MMTIISSCSPCVKSSRENDKSLPRVTAAARRAAQGVIQNGVKCAFVDFFKIDLQDAGKDVVLKLSTLV
jgi:hypothetical protein